MEAQLREYRTRKSQEREQSNQQQQQHTGQQDGRGVLTRLWSSKVKGHRPEGEDAQLSNAAAGCNEQRNTKMSTRTTLDSPCRENRPSNHLLAFISQDRSFLTNLTFLKLSLWLVLFALFVHLEFGAVFVILSFFYVIYSTLAPSRTREAGEPSAYSVFNPNCEQIDGTLTADQFERELKYGIMSSRK